MKNYAVFRMFDVSNILRKFLFLHMSEHVQFTYKNWSYVIYMNSEYNIITQVQDTTGLVRNLTAIDSEADLMKICKMLMESTIHIQGYAPFKWDNIVAAVDDFEKQDANKPIVFDIGDTVYIVMQAMDKGMIESGVFKQRITEINRKDDGTYMYVTPTFRFSYEAIGVFVFRTEAEARMQLLQTSLQ